MKRYIKSSNDLWYTDKNGNQTHDFFEVTDIDSVRRVLRNAVNDEFADAVAEQIQDYIADRDYEITDFINGLDDIQTHVDDIADDVSGGVDDLRDIANELAEVLGDEDDKVNELISRIFGKLDQVDEDIATTSGYIYDLKDVLSGNSDY